MIGFMRRQELGNGGFTRYDRYNARSTKKMAIFDLRNVIFNTIVCPCVAICKVGARA